MEPLPRDCFADLKPLGYDAYAKKFPPLKETELMADKVYATPWDSGAKEALDVAAHQIADASGLPVKE